MAATLLSSCKYGSGLWLKGVFFGLPSLETYRGEGYGSSAQPCLCILKLAKRVIEKGGYSQMLMCKHG